MRINHAKLVKLPVETQSGISLGKVTDCIYDVDTWAIAQVIVASGLMRATEYSIHPHQIISISESRIIVADAAFQSRAMATEPLSSSSASPALLREGE